MHSTVRTDFFVTEPLFFFVPECNHTITLKKPHYINVLICCYFCSTQSLLHNMNWHKSEWKTPYLQVNVVFWSGHQLWASLVPAKALIQGTKSVLRFCLCSWPIVFYWHTFMQWCIKHVKVCYIGSCAQRLWIEPASGFIFYDHVRKHSSTFLPIPIFTRTEPSWTSHLWVPAGMEPWWCVLEKGERAKSHVSEGKSGGFIYYCSRKLHDYLLVSAVSAYLCRFKNKNLNRKIVFSDVAFSKDKPEMARLISS